MVSFRWSLAKDFLLKEALHGANCNVDISRNNVAKSNTVKSFWTHSKIRNALPSQMLREKSSSAPCYPVFDFSGNIVARKIHVASCPV